MKIAGMSLKPVKLGITLSAVVLAVGCSQNANESTTSRVTTNFSMTGSASTFTVAKTSFERWVQALLPTANAFTPASMVDANNQTVVLSQAWVTIKEVEFEASESAGPSDSSEINFQGPYYVDLLDPAPAPLDTATLPDVVYRRIKMKFENAGDAASLSAVGAPSDLQNNSMVFEGTVNGKSFKYMMDDGVELEIAGAGGIAPSSNQNLLVSVQLANAIRQIDLDTYVTNGVVISSSNRVTPGSSVNPCPLIHASATDLYTCFRKGFEQQAKLGKDENGDGELEVGEDKVED